MTSAGRLGRVVPESDRAHAVRVAAGLVVPGLALVALDRPSLIIYAVFGSFTGMYGRADSRVMRLLHQSQGALLLLSGTALGVLLAHEHASAQVLIATAAAFAVAGSLLADFFALRPDGPFYGLFALGAIAGVPSAVLAPVASWLIAAAGAAIAICIGLSGGDARPITPRAVTEAFRGQRVRSRPAAVLHAFRYAVAVTFAGGLALVVGLSHVNWAIAGAAVTLAAADPRGRFWRGVHRIVGTLAGLGITALLLATGMGPRSLAIVVIVLLFPAELFMAANYTLALSFFTPMIMLMTELAAPIGVRELLESRALGTMLGVLCGFVVTYVIRDRTERAAGAGASRSPAGPRSRA
ncbi:FUSC family protein [Nocardioides maradonensis]